MRFGKDGNMSNTKNTLKNENGMEIIAPWYDYQKKIKALFEQDPQIIVGEIYEPQGQAVDYAFGIEVRNHKKFMALISLLPEQVEFGNVTLGIVLYDEENISDTDDLAETYRNLFKDNPIVREIPVVEDMAGVKHAFILFQPWVIQYYRDEMMDYNGLFSGLAQDIARELFKDETGTIHFCTAPIEKTV